MRKAPLDPPPTVQADSDSKGSPDGPADDVMPSLLLPDDAVAGRKAAIGRRVGRSRPRTPMLEPQHPHTGAQETAATEGEIAKDRDSAEDCALLHPAPAESKAYAPAKRR
jgi:hypothetical protein